MWFQVELPQPVMVTEVEFDSPVPPTGRLGGCDGGRAPVLYPRGYKVEVSLDSAKWGAKPVVGHDVRTVQQESWAGLKNGVLLTQAKTLGSQCC